MSRPGVFGHLVGLLASHPENVASEALTYILRNTPVAATAFEEFAQRAAAVPSGLHFQSQFAAPSGATPDVAGLAVDGSSPLLVEVKYWAGLTDNQPNGYLRLLPAESPGLLLFVVPSIRIGLLWTEVLGRLDPRVVGAESGTPEYRHVAITGGSVLAMTSWRLLLSTLAEAAADAGDRSASSDIDQLRGLCDRMDSEAFLPLASNELSGSVATRLVQYGDLVERVVATLVESGIATLKTSTGGGLSASAGAGWWGRFLYIGGVVSLLRVAAAPWARDRATPIWLQVGYKSEPPVPGLLAALSPLVAERDRIFVRQSYVDVAIDVPFNQERDDVVTAMFQQVARVAELLTSSASTWNAL